MRTAHDAQHETHPMTTLHPLLAEDAPVVAASRAATAPYKGQAMSREAYDAMLSAVPAPLGVRMEPGTVGGVPGWWCRPAEARPGARLLYIHGGGYTLGSAQAYRHLAGQLAQRTRADTFVPDYRLSPEHPFPVAIEDVWAVYQGLVQEGAEAIVISGDSAGGGLTLALLSLVAARTQAGLLQARGAAVLSPWTDLTVTADSYQTRADADPVFTREALAAMARQYLEAHDAADPRASPLHGALSGLPPIRIDVGEDEVLLDDSRHYAERARAAGTEVTLAVWRGMAHVFPSSIDSLRTARRALDEIGRFLAERLEGGVILPVAPATERARTRA